MYNKRSTLNYELYNEHINYDPVTGIFTWKKSQSRRYQAGMQIGNIKSRIDKYGVSRDYLYVGFRGEQTPGARVAWLLMTGKEASGKS